MSNVLNKLINLGYLKEDIQCSDADIDAEYFVQSIDGSILFAKEEFCLIECFSAEAVLLLQRALFDACVERGYDIFIKNNKLEITVCRKLIYGNELVYSGDTSRKSWVAAFCEVVGIE